MPFVVVFLGLYDTKQIRFKGVVNVAVVIDIMCARLRDAAEGTHSFM
jgi:hypothetical protein